MKLEFLPAGSDDCPLVRAYDFEPGEVAPLFAALSALASGERSSVAVHALPGVEAVGGCRLLLLAGPRDRGLVQLATPEHFECVLTPGSWDNVAGLTEPFLAEVRGFQWLVDWGEARWLLARDRCW